jgi:hypothetical protein
MKKPFHEPDDPPETFEKLLDRFQVFARQNDLSPEAFFACFSKYDLARLAYLFSNSLACASFPAASSLNISATTPSNSTQTFFA